MKKLLSFLILATPLFLLGNESSTKIIFSENEISIYEVKLVCNAAPDIGCGSRSKPILLDMEAEQSIKEAWLNKAGTHIALVWEEKKDLETANAIFKKHEQDVNLLEGTELEKQLTDFESNDWYKGVDVDKLSEIEADRIASSIVSSVKDKDFLEGKGRNGLHSEVKAFIFNETVTLEDVSLLSTPSYYDKWSKEIGKIMESYISKEKASEIKIQFKSSSEKSCCSKAKKKDCSKKSCCKKSGS